MKWLFAAEQPLPSGYHAVEIANVSSALGARRLAEAAAIVGEPAARAAARNAGRYELSAAAVRELRLAGLEIGDDGEVPALSPARWAEEPARDEWPEECAQAEVAGVALTKEQRVEFLKFLGRNRFDVDAAAPRDVVEIARSYFFLEPVIVVIRAAAGAARS